MYIKIKDSTLALMELLYEEKVGEYPKYEIISPTKYEDSVEHTSNIHRTCYYGEERN